jgi:hypothetical protein
MDCDNPALNAYVWQYVGPISDAYHPSGGVLVIAADEARAKEVAQAEAERRGTERPIEWEDLAPVVIPTTTTEERVMFFPDEGCC